jgi:hypothetical protein
MPRRFSWFTSSSTPGLFVLTACARDMTTPITRAQLVIHGLGPTLPSNAALVPGACTTTVPVMDG